MLTPYQNELIHREIDGENSPEESAEVQALLEREPDALALMTSLQSLDSMLSEVPDRDPHPRVRAQINTVVSNALPTLRYTKESTQKTGFTTQLWNRFTNLIEDSMLTKKVLIGATTAVAVIAIIGYALVDYKPSVSDAGTIGATEGMGGVQQAGRYKGRVLTPSDVTLSNPEIMSLLQNDKILKLVKSGAFKEAMHNDVFRDLTASEQFHSLEQNETFHDLTASEQFHDIMANEQFHDLFANEQFLLLLANEQFQNLFRDNVSRDNVNRDNVNRDNVNRDNVNRDNVNRDLTASEVYHDLSKDEQFHDIMSSEVFHDIMANEAFHDIMANEQYHDLFANETFHDIMANEQYHDLFANEVYLNLFANEAFRDLTASELFRDLSHDVSLVDVFLQEANRDNVNRDQQN